MVVSENIAYDFEGAYRHGIYRNIKDKHPLPASAWYKERYVDIELLSVTRDHEPEPYTLESYDGLSVRIGDPDSTITGRHLYQIKYVLRGALSETREGVEFYWNVTGDEWPVAIEDVFVGLRTYNKARILPTQACYAGYPDSTDSCARMEYRTSEDVGFFGQKGLLPSQQLTIAEQVSMPGPVPANERYNILLVGLIVVSLWLVGIGVWAYRWRTEYKLDQSIIPQYEPYQDFKPMFTGVLFDGRLDSRDISAGIVYLAQQGYISIKQTNEKILWLFDTTDYEITYLKDSHAPLTHFQKEILSLLFKGVYTTGITMKLSSIKKDTTKQRENYKTVQGLKKAVVKDMVGRGLLEQRVPRVVVGVLASIALWAALFLAQPTWEMFGVVVTLVFILFLLTVAVAMVAGNERRTRKGYEALNYLKGFKDFLSTTEKERYKFHNAPAKSPEQFMEYLPYAIAFGVEREWAEVFKDIQIDSPDWYQSSVSGATFSAVAFTSDLGAFSTSLSGSAGTSGSSGGGSAGGGGGGGGGGSW